jgi:hypothetical protein
MATKGTNVIPHNTTDVQVIALPFVAGLLNRAWQSSTVVVSH